ncbi:Putative LOC100880868, partial [Caligus rogercresseyi]
SSSSLSSCSELEVSPSSTPLTPSSPSSPSSPPPVDSLQELKSRLKDQGSVPILVSSTLAESQDFMDFLGFQSQAEGDGNHGKRRGEPPPPPPGGSSPQPGSSREQEDKQDDDAELDEDKESDEEEEEDDITLQDLVALETMEEEDDEEEEEDFQTQGLNLGIYAPRPTDTPCPTSLLSSAEKALEPFLSHPVSPSPSLHLNAEKTHLLPSSESQGVLGSQGSTWKCSTCFLVFPSGSSLQEHLSLITSSPFKCSRCHIRFASLQEARAHKKAEDPQPNAQGEYVCQRCDRVLPDKELLLKHREVHAEEKPFECTECGKKFLKASLLKSHTRRHFEVGSYACLLCEKRFYSPSKLKEHIRVHTETERSWTALGHAQGGQGAICSTCGKLFSTQRDLDWHVEAVHEREPKKCSYCGDVFVHASTLTRHIRLKHQENFIPAHRKSSLYANINKHIKSKHHGDRLYNCDICKRGFATKHSLSEHVWQHKSLTSRPFKCHLCPKAYLRPNLLEAHPYVCNECGAKFVSKCNWQRHVQEHSGSRNFECPRAYYLTDHLKVHTGEKPFSCGICGKRTATRSNYNSHLRTHITRDPINSEV